VTEPNDQMTNVRRRLGEALTGWRERAGFKQAELARRVCYDRTTVCHAERGGQTPAAEFWRACDRELGARGALIALYERWQEAKQERAEAARRRTLHGRRLAVGQPTPSPSLYDQAAILAMEPDRVMVPGIGWVYRRELLRLLAVAAAVPVGESVTALPESLERLALVLDGRIKVDDGVIAEAEAVTALLRSQHPRLSARCLFPLVSKQLETVATLIGNVRSDGHERSLTQNASELATMGGLLTLFDRRDTATAERHYELGLKAASLAHDRALEAHALTSLSGIALTAGRGQKALDLAQRARERVADGGGRLTRSFVAVAAAEGHAAVGDREACMQAIAVAEHEMTKDDGPPDPGWVDFFDPARLESYKGACFLRLGMTAEAEAVLRRALELIPESSVKYRCITLADLASTLADQGEIEESTLLARQALDVAKPLHYSAGLERVRELAREKLSAHRTVSGVPELLEHLAAAG
jgi:tetratricopeptide (TPR) repeat protein